jgi:hypothetical protein
MGIGGIGTGSRAKVKRAEQSLSQNWDEPAPESEYSSERSTFAYFPLSTSGVVFERERGGRHIPLPPFFLLFVCYCTHRLSGVTPKIHIHLFANPLSLSLPTRALYLKNRLLFLALFLAFLRAIAVGKGGGWDIG